MYKKSTVCEISTCFVSHYGSLLAPVHTILFNVCVSHCGIKTGDICRKNCLSCLRADRRTSERKTGLRDSHTLVLNVLDGP